jgi:hypothetical protein
MKKKIWLLGFSVIILFAYACNSNTNKTENKATEQQKISENMYACPMHPEVIQNGPGNCPKCGMELEKIEKASADSTATADSM